MLIRADLSSGLAASIALSRASQVKERRIRVVGARAAVLFDDVRAPDRLHVDGAEVRVAWREPLAVEVEHFLDCVAQRAQPLTPFEEGVRVVRALAQVEEICGALAPGSPGVSAGVSPG